MKVGQSCPTLCDPMDCSPPGFFVRGILQARILEWVAIPFSRGSSWPRDQTRVSHIAGRFFTNWTTICMNVFFYIFKKKSVPLYLVSAKLFSVVNNPHILLALQNKKFISWSHCMSSVDQQEGLAHCPCS